MIDETSVSVVDDDALKAMAKDRLAGHLEGRDGTCSCDLCVLAQAFLTAAKARDKAIQDRAHTQYWYAVRLEVIKDVSKRVGIWDEVSAIIANGSGTRQKPDGTYIYEPPTYAQQINVAFHRAQAAEGGLIKYGGHLVTCDLRAYPESLYPDAKPTCTCGFEMMLQNMKVGDKTL